MSRLLSWKTYLPRATRRGVDRCRLPAACDAVRRGRLEAAIEPIDVAIAAVRLGRWRDRDVHVVADLGDHRRRLRHQAIRELHQHLGRARLAAVQAAHEMIVRLGLRHDRAHLRFAHAARIGDLREVRAILRDIANVLVGRDPDDHELASFVGLSDGLDLHAWRRLRERAIVFQDIRVVREFRRRADVIAEDVLRRRDSRDAREVVDQRAAVLRLARPGCVEFRELFILFLVRVAGLIDHRL